MKIQVLGIGCPRCQQLYANVQQAVGELGIEAELVKVEDVAAIAAFRVMSTPALAIDGEVKVAGRVPSAREIRQLLTA